MSIWYFELLGICPTQDIRVVRRAYSVALKKIDQETQADAFSHLREAYELAQRWGNNENDDHLSQSESDDFHPSWIDDTSAKANTACDTVEPDNRQTERDEKDRAKIEDLFIKFIAKVMMDPKTGPERLKEILSDHALMPIDSREWFESALINWLHDHPYPNYALLMAAITEFGWESVHPRAEGSILAWLKETLNQRQDLQWLEKTDKECLTRFWRAVEDAECNGNLIKHHEYREIAEAVALVCHRAPQWSEMCLSRVYKELWRSRLESTKADNQHSSTVIIDTKKARWLNANKRTVAFIIAIVINVLISTNWFSMDNISSTKNVLQLKNAKAFVEKQRDADSVSATTYRYSLSDGIDICIKQVKKALPRKAKITGINSAFNAKVNEKKPLGVLTICDVTYQDPNNPLKLLRMRMNHSTGEFTKPMSVDIEVSWFTDAEKASFRLEDHLITLERIKTTNLTNIMKKEHGKIQMRYTNSAISNVDASAPDIFSDKPTLRIDISGNLKENGVQDDGYVKLSIDGMKIISNHLY